MKLNVDIILDHLREINDVRVFGIPRKRLSLNRPVLYTGREDVFENDHVYVAESHRLTEDPSFLGKPVIVAIGPGLPNEYANGPCVVLWLPDGELFSVFNGIQKVFDAIDSWEARLTEILHTTADIKEMVDISYPIFRNPIKVIDHNFAYLAYSTVMDRDKNLIPYGPDDNGYVHLDAIKQSIMTNMNLSVRQPFYTDGGEGKDCLCVNLSDQDRYIGSLTISYWYSPTREGDVYLAKHFGRMLEKAILRCDFSSDSPRRQAYKLFSLLISGKLPSEEFLHNLATNSKAGWYICGKATISERIHKKIPVEFICRQIEAGFPEAYAFEHEGSVAVVFTYSKRLWKQDKNLSARLRAILEKLELKMGVSDYFADLKMMASYYKQATIGLRLGYQAVPEDNLYYFRDYALLYMLENCCGELSHQMLYIQGMDELLEHDNDPSNKAKYTHTLWSYLENNMNVMKTAHALNIHRSTLQERLRSIEKLLDINLEDPDQRLRLMISLRIMKYDQWQTEAAQRRHMADSREEVGIVYVQDTERF